MTTEFTTKPNISIKFLYNFQIFETLETIYEEIEIFIGLDAYMM